MPVGPSDRMFILDVNIVSIEAPHFGTLNLPIMSFSKQTLLNTLQRSHANFHITFTNKRNELCHLRQKNKKIDSRICALLGYYAASCGNCLPTFRDNVSVPSSRVKSPSRKESQRPITSILPGKVRAR
jgi:hypothetical protein